MPSKAIHQSDKTASASADGEKISQERAGVLAIKILQARYMKHGIDLRIPQFDSMVGKFSRKTGVPESRIRTFFERFIIPDMLQHYHVRTLPNMAAVDEASGQFALLILQQTFSYDPRTIENQLRRWRDECRASCTELVSLVNDYLLPAFVSHTRICNPEEGGT